MNKDFINWKSYFLEEHINEYNLKETEHIKLFNTNDLNMLGDNQINYLNKYLGELVMMYYIWKNNLKSDYIVISQYRKDFATLNFDRLKNNEIQVYSFWKQSELYNPVDEAFNEIIDPEHILKNKFIKYLYQQKIYDNNQINKLLFEQPTVDKMACFVFGMKWEIYCQICEFIFGYLDYILPNDGWKNIDQLIQLRDNQYQLYLKYNEEPKDWSYYTKTDPRYIVWLVERIISACLPSLYTIFNDPIYIQYNILTYCNDIYQIPQFYRKNKKINTYKIFVCVDNDHYNEFMDQYENVIGHYMFPNLEILHINDVNNVIDNDNIIQLNINEYIDIDDTDNIGYLQINELQKHIKSL